jgi:predicted ATP-binding protein involved in virulence
MTDANVIKELEKEIRVQLKKVDEVERLERNTFKTNNYQKVIALDISDNTLSKIPKSVLKLNKLKTLNINQNQIKDITPLLRIKGLEYLYCEDNHALGEKEMIEFLTESKNLKVFDYFLGPFWEIMHKEALNHNLYLNTRHSRDELPSSLNIDNYDVYPPLSMVELGYRDPQLYYKNYPDNYIQEYIDTESKYEASKNKASYLGQVKDKIIHTLLHNYYFDHRKLNTLPYAVRRLSVYYYQGIEELLIDNIAGSNSKQEISDPHWIFVTGENGYGKTSLLQAIVIGMHGNEDGKSILNKSADIFIELKNKDKHIAQYCSEILEPFEHFAAYGPARLTKNPKPINENKTNSLFNVYGELLDIEERLIAWEKDRKQKSFYESAKNILLKLLSPQIKDIVINREGTDTQVKYIEFDKNDKKDFSELASGYRSIITMVGDIIIRLSKSQKEIKNFEELAGIVVIDELDLHLHPKWQKELVKQLTKLFPKIQFIASTHSPIPILGAPKNSIIINVNRNTEDGITAEKLDVDFSRLLPNAILSSPIFDFDDFIAESKSKEEFYHPENSFEEIKNKTQVQKRLEKFLTKDKANELLNILNPDDNAEGK